MCGVCGVLGGSGRVPFLDPMGRGSGIFAVREPTLGYTSITMCFFYVFPSSLQRAIQGVPHLFRGSFARGRRWCSPGGKAFALQMVAALFLGREAIGPHGLNRSLH